MEWRWWFLLVIALVALFVSVWNAFSLKELRRRLYVQASQAAESLQQGEMIPPKTVAVVYNPAKIDDLDELRSVVTQTALDAGYSEPHWFETTREDPGVAQTQAALEMNPAVVIAVGGDGTVRVVAGELAGTDVPLGIIPAGTGNLLARNLNLPINSSLRNLVSVAITGRRRRIDVGRISAPELSAENRALIEDLSEETKIFSGEVPFLVIAGMGFDAEVMSGADDSLKASMGWAAYLVSGMKYLSHRKMQATICAGTDTDFSDSSQELNEGAYGEDASINQLHPHSFKESNARESNTVEARSILFGNCTKLPAGFVLAPDARIDDGWLDVMIVDTKGGLVGWADLVRRVTLQSLGVRKQVLPEVGSIDLKRMRSAHVKVEQPELVEADGDTLGYAMEVNTRLETGALIVHVA